MFVQPRSRTILGLGLGLLACQATQERQPDTDGPAAGRGGGAGEIAGGGTAGTSAQAGNAATSATGDTGPLTPSSDPTPTARSAVPSINHVAFDNCRAEKNRGDNPGETWIVAGQSNADENDLWPPFQSTLQEKVPGLVVDKVGDVWPASPITLWDEGQPGWTQLVDRLKGAASPIGGFLWYQGEDEVSKSPIDYQRKLTSLVTRVRALVKRPDLPAIIIQLANQTHPDAGPSLALVREAEVRFADGDRRAEVVPALDSAMVDWVHVTRPARRELGRRAAIAALGLAYDVECATTPGARLVRQSFEDASRRSVVIEFRGVYGSLTVAPKGWENGFGALPGVPPAIETNTTVVESVEFAAKDLVFPTSVEAVAANRLRLRFAQPLPAGAALGWGMAGNQGLARPYGAGYTHEELMANTPMAGIKDNEGFPPVAYFARPIAAAP